MVNSGFRSDESVNQLLNYSKAVVDQVCGPCGDREGRVMQYAIFAGLVSYYGVDHIDEITKAFKYNSFIYTSGSIGDFVARQHNVPAGVLKSASDKNNCAFFWKDYFPDSTRTSWQSAGRIIVSGQKSNAPDFILENTTHEVNHAINSMNNDVIQVSPNSIWTRMGLRLKKMCAPDQRCEIIEEAVNVLQTAEIMDHILSFSNYDIKDREMKYFFDSIKYAANKKRQGIGYTLVTPLIRPLYENNNFNVVLKRTRIAGNVGFVNDEFDKKVGANSFDELSRACDSIYARGANSLSISCSQDKVGQLVKKYTR